MRVAVVLAAIVLLIGACQAGRPSEPPPPPAVVQARRADAPPIPTAAFEAPPPADPIVDLGAAAEWTCATRKSGHVDCWGRAFPTLTRLPGITDALAVRGSSYGNGCILRRSKVTCGSLDDLDHPSDIALGDARAVFVGMKTCAVRADHRLACWNAADEPVLEQVRDVASLASAEDVACAVHTNGHVSCIDSYSPADGIWRPVALDHVRALAFVQVQGDNGDYDGGGYAIRDDGEVRSFGIDGHHPLAGHPTVHAGWSRSSGHDSPLAQLRGATTLIAGEDDTITALVAGSVVVADMAGSAKPHRIPLLTDAVAITRSCALRAQGSVVCWGDGHLDAPAAVPRLQ